MLKRKPETSNKIKVKVKHDENNKVTEYLPICKDGHPPEFLLDTFEHALVLESCYDLITGGEAKNLMQTVT